MGKLFGRSGHYPTTPSRGVYSPGLVITRWSSYGLVMMMMTMMRIFGKRTVVAIWHEAVDTKFPSFGQQPCHSFDDLCHDHHLYHDHDDFYDHVWEDPKSWSSFNVIQFNVIQWWSWLCWWSQWFLMILMMLITFYDVLKSKGMSEWYEGGDKEEKNLPCCGNPTNPHVTAYLKYSYFLSP